MPLMPDDSSLTTRRATLKGALALAGIAVAAPLAAAPGDPVLEPAIVFVRVIGRWSTAGERGFMRMILARSSQVSDAVHLHVQWVMVSADNLSASLVAGTEIAEVFAGRFRINDYRVDQGQDETLVMLDIVRPDGAEESWELILRLPGDVSFRSVSN
jgi:hypothetical protein